MVLASSLPASAAMAQDEVEAARIMRPTVLLDKTSLRGSHYVAELEGGGLAELTLHPTLQKSVEEALAEHPLPFGAAVVISVPDGKVLALAGYSKNDPTLDASTLALRPWAPAASVFKIVAASSLLQEGRIQPGKRVCYHGGVSAIARDNLVDVPRIDRLCANLAYGIGKSQNAIIAKLVARHLRPEQLEQTAMAFGFGQPVDFDAEVEPSEVDIPRDPLEFARAAAGFWHSSLSVLHGALLAATIANHGVMPAAHILDHALDAQGKTLDVPKLPARRVLSPSVAGEVGEMMLLTTTMGTARRSFRDRRGHRTLPFEVAGKTGTLFHRGRPQDPALPAAVMPEDGRIGYSWFVGFAPAAKPRIAFAVLLGTPIPQPLRAHAVARHIMAEYAVSEMSIKHHGLLARR